MRHDGRKDNQLRPIKVTRNYTCHAEGSVLVEFGNTKVLCNASVIDGVPRFLKGKKRGWVTAEYSMLPRATHTRTGREASRGKQGGRTLEIQRLIARSLRAAVDLNQLGEFTIQLDCDVLQADGGTRTASISGACIALVDAINWMRSNNKINNNPLKQMIAAVSVGIVSDKVVLDLDYIEDSSCGTDMNIVMTEDGGLIEIQGTAENGSFSTDELTQMLEFANQGISEIINIQHSALNAE